MKRVGLQGCMQPRRIKLPNKSLRLPKDLTAKVQELANENNMSFNRVIIQCIEYALDNVEKEE